MKIKLLYLKSLIIPVIILLISCKSPGASDSKTACPAKDNRIAFVHLKLVGKSSKIDFEYISGELQPGRLKDDYSRDTVPVPGYLACRFLDLNGIILKNIIIENPLEKYVEYLNSGNQYERKLVISQESDLFLRFQYKSEYRYLLIELYDDNLHTKELFKHELTYGDIDEN